MLISWGTTALLVTGCEMILRQTSLNDEFESYRKNGQQKAILFGAKNDYSHTWKDAGVIHHTDRQGYRIQKRVADWADRPELARLFVLGGSSAFGYRISDDKTWATLLDNFLAEDQKDTVIINAGNNGHNSVQILLKSYFELAQHNPTHLLIYQNRNDAQERPLKPAEVFIDKELVFSSSMVEYLRAIGYGNFYFQSVLGHMLKTSIGKYFIKQERLQRTESGIRDMPTEKLNLLKEHNGERYRRNLTALTTLARLEDTEPLFITFLHNPNGMEPHKSALITHLNTVMRKVSKDLEVPLIDLEKKFRNQNDKAPFFQDDGYHPSVKGAQYIAKGIREDLIEILSKKQD